MGTVVVVGTDEEVNWAVVADLVARAPPPRGRVILVTCRPRAGLLAAATETVASFPLALWPPIDYVVVDSDPTMWQDARQALFAELLAIDPQVRFVAVVCGETAGSLPMTIQWNALLLVKTWGHVGGPVDADRAVVRTGGGSWTISVVTRALLRARMQAFLLGTAARSKSPVRVLVRDVLPGIAARVASGGPLVDSGDTWVHYGRAE